MISNIQKIAPLNVYNTKSSSIKTSLTWFYAITENEGEIR